MNIPPAVEYIATNQQHQVLTTERKDAVQDIGN